jgi:hypothetical protein
MKQETGELNSTYGCWTWKEILWWGGEATERAFFAVFGDGILFFCSGEKEGVVLETTTTTITTTNHHDHYTTTYLFSIQESYRKEKKRKKKQNNKR